MSEKEMEKFNRSSMGDEITALETLRDMYADLLETADEDTKKENKLVVDALTDAIVSLDAQESELKKSFYGGYTAGYDQGYEDHAKGLAHKDFSNGEARADMLNAFEEQTRDAADIDIEEI